MALDATGLAADLAEIEADMPTSVTITHRTKTQTVVASVGEMSAGESASEEGIIGEDTTPVTIRTALLAWVPVPGDVVTIGGVRHSVATVRHTDGDIAYTLDCVGITK